MVPERKRAFHYDVYEDNGIDGQRFFGVKLSIDHKVVAKARATSKRRLKKKLPKEHTSRFKEKLMVNKTGLFMRLSYHDKK